MTEEIKIGDFSRPVVEKPAQAAPASPASPAAERLDTLERKLETDAQSAETILQPHLTYEDRLKEIGITRDEAARLVDDVLIAGHYAEDMQITTRVKVRFRTRLYRDTQRTQSYLEVARPVYDTHYQEIVARYALAASLETLGKDHFEHPGRKAKGEAIEQAFQNRLSFVDGLPDPTLRLLFSKLFKFDQKVRVVLEEGAVENF